MIKSVTQHSYFEKKPKKQMGRLQTNPSIGWVHPTSTHARPFVWGHKKCGVHTASPDWLQEILLPPWVICHFFAQANGVNYGYIVAHKYFLHTQTHKAYEEVPIGAKLSSVQRRTSKSWPPMSIHGKNPKNNLSIIIISCLDNQDL